MRIPRFSFPVALALALLLPSTATADVFGPLEEPGTEQPAGVQSGPTITSDQADYEPNSAVTLTGAGWQPGESVRIVVTDDGLQPDQPWQRDVTVVADQDGNIVDQFDLPDWIVATYTVTATGESSGTTWTTFTDAHTERGCGNAATLVVTTPTDEFDVEAPGANTCSLREAIVAANSDAGHTEVTAITVPADTYTFLIAGTGENNGAEGDLDVREDLAINGAGSGTTIVEAGTTNANGLDRVFELHVQGTDLDLNGLTVRHGLLGAAGGGIRMSAGGAGADQISLDLSDVVVTQNSITGGTGAGIHIENANNPVTLLNSEVTNNTGTCAGCNGGGIFNAGTLTVTNSNIDFNKSRNDGGGIFNNGDVALDDSTVNNNESTNTVALPNANGTGGGIYQQMSNSSLELDNGSTVNNNIAPDHAGGIRATNGAVTILGDSEVIDNTAGTGDGGGLNTGGGGATTVNIEDSTISGNTAGRHGGGHYTEPAGTANLLVTIAGSTIAGNTAGANGGGLRLHVTSSIANSTIDDNDAGSAGAGTGGGVWVTDRIVDFYNVTVSDNSAGEDVGDGLYRDGGNPNNGRINLRNTIVADVLEGSNCASGADVVSDAIVDVANNLDSGETCALGADPDSLSSATEDLGPLQDNGGPTETRALGADSDAIDMADATVCASAPVNGVDQRGETRPVGPECDIGAFEGEISSAPTSATVSGSKFEDPNGDGIRDVGEDGLEGWVIHAFLDEVEPFGEPDDPNSPVASATTDADGDYTLVIDPGDGNEFDYVICEESQTGWMQSAPSGTDCSTVDGHEPGGHLIDELARGDEEVDKDFANFAVATVSGSKFEDPNGDGIRDVGEDGLEGWVIHAFLDEVEPFGEPDDPNSPVASATTDADGDYTLVIDPGDGNEFDYVICEESQTGWMQSAPSGTDCSTVDGHEPGGHLIDELARGDEEVDKDFANFAVATVSGSKFEDPNGDGIRDVGEDGLEGWVIHAFLDEVEPFGEPDDPNSPVASATTDADGDYTLVIDPGDGNEFDYVICEESQTGWMQSAPSGTDCSTVDGHEPGGHLIDELARGDEEVDKDFANFAVATVSGTKFNDADQNDAQGGTEDGLPDWVINAFLDEVAPFGVPDSTTPVATAMTDADGNYTLAIDPGDGNEFDYVICEEQQTGWAQSAPNGTACSTVDADAPGGHLIDELAREDDETDKDFGNFQEFVSGALVTAGSCTFDKSDRTGRQFRLTYTPDPFAAVQPSWKLSASNPGQFFLGVAYAGTSDSIDIDIPYPFVTKGATPVKIYSNSTESTQDGKQCRAPAGSLLGSQSDPEQIALADYGTGGFSSSPQTITIDLDALGNPTQVFVRIHLDYGLKHVATGCRPVAINDDPDDPDHPYPNADCTTPVVTILNYDDYEFSFSGGATSGSDTVQNENVFKKDPGFAGLVTQANTGEPIGGTPIEIWQGTTKKNTVYTDQDSWYQWPYKYTGKATTFTVKLPAYGLSQSVTMKSNGFMVVNFTVPEGATPITTTPTPTPTPTPTKPGGGKK